MVLKRSQQFFFSIPLCAQPALRNGKKNMRKGEASGAVQYPSRTGQVYVTQLACTHDTRLLLASFRNKPSYSLSRSSLALWLACVPHPPSPSSSLSPLTSVSIAQRLPSLWWAQQEKRQQKKCLRSFPRTYLSRVFPQVRSVHERGSGLGSIEEVRVVAHLFRKKKSLGRGGNTS